MRILGLFHKYPPIHNAGAEVMVHAMLRDLIARGHDCTISYPGAERSEYQGIHIAPTPAMDNRIVDAAAASDILITHLDVTRRAMRVANRVGRPLVHIVHNHAQLDHHQVTGAALVVFNSEWVAHENRRWPGDTLIVRPPVWPADYETTPERADRITLLNLTRPKGAYLFFELARLCPDRLFLGVKGAYGTQAIPRRLPRNVEILEHTAAVVDDVYARTRVLIVPSSYESWGRVAIEAASSGIPVLASPTPGLLESLGDAGIFLDRGKPSDWVDALEVLDRPADYAATARACRARALDLADVAHADLDAFALRLEEIVAAYAPRRDPGEDPMAILSAAGHKGPRCPVCGARHCACGPEAGSVANPIVRPYKRGTGPKSVYKTALGDFRLSDEGARQRGLLPDGPDLPHTVARALRVAGADVEVHQRAYTAADDDSRTDYLTIISQTRAKDLADNPDELLELLTIEVSLSTIVDLGGQPAPPPTEAPVDGRVGEMLEWAGKDPTRLAEALTAEKAHKARPTLVAELERLLTP